MRRDRVSNKQVQVQVEDTFCYVPIKETLKLVLRHPDSSQLVLRSSTDGVSGVVEDWLGAENGKRL